MTRPGPLEGGSPRVIVQYLEGGAASGAIAPDAAAARLREAARRIPISDVCLGWGLPAPLLETVTSEARRLGAATWLWHPFLAGDGRYVPGRDAAIGADGRPVPAPGGMDEFAFDCPVRPDGLAAALERLATALGTADWDGVFLDKIRWPSPTADPASQLACFCEACRTSAGEAGIDLAAVAHGLARAGRSAEGRLETVRALLGDPATASVGDDALDDFLAWRAGRIGVAVTAAAALVGRHHARDGRSLRVGLDVFAPSLARAVGQDLTALVPLSEFSKGMLYLGTHGPAGLAYELCRLARWLADAGLRSPVGQLAEILGYDLPPLDALCTVSLGSAAFRAELTALVGVAGPRAAAGVDAVRIDGLAVLDDAGLEDATAIAAAEGVPIVLSWDLWHISGERLDRVAATLARVPAPTSTRAPAPAPALAPEDRA